METKFDDYQLVTDTSPTALAATIKTRLSEGWQLWGSPSVAMGTSHPIYIQALTKPPAQGPARMVPLKM